MKNLFIMLSIIALHNVSLCMEEVQVSSTVEEHENTATNLSAAPLELKEVTIDTAMNHEQLHQKINMLLEKISDLEKNQKNQRSCKSKIFMAVSIMGSCASTMGLLLYIASWYVEF